MNASLPVMGLVCITCDKTIRYRTITRTNYLKLPASDRAARLEALYHSNFLELLRALEFCRDHDIRLYRVTSQLFPMSDLGDGVGAAVLDAMADEFRQVGALSRTSGVRVVVHPEQFVVLSSDSPEVVINSQRVLEGHAAMFDCMDLPQSPWAMILIHGGKRGRSEALVERIAALPNRVRSRLALENDEHGYGAAEILEVCRASGVPMVFDAHHHVIHDQLSSYEDASVTFYTEAARLTWPNPGWQIAHLSNGREGFLDRRHSDLIDQFPSAFLSVPFVEVEAKSKDVAIADLRSRLELPEPLLLVPSRSSQIMAGEDD